MSFSPKIIKKVTMPLLKQQIDVPIFVRVDGAIYVGKELKGDKAGEKPADIMHVTDLTSGEVMQYLVPSVVKSTLEEEYANEAYVGKCFALTKHNKKEGKRYFTFSIDEIENPLGDTQKTAKTKAA